MKKLPALLVVEGKTDVDFIGTFLDCETVITNGSEVSRETIEFIREASKIRPVIVLTDPDSPGKRIRDVLDAEIPGLLHAYIPKKYAIKKHKVGVAESRPDVVLEALENLVPAGNNENSNLTMSDLIDLGLQGNSNSQTLRDELGLKLHIGHTNAKTFLKRCKALGLTKEDLERAMENE